MLSLRTSSGSNVTTPEAASPVDGYVLAWSSAANAYVPTPSGGPGGSGNSVSVSVDFGASFTQFAETVVTGQSWVEADSEIVVTVLADAGKAMESAVLELRPVIGSLVAGVGFTLSVFAPNKAKGTYTFSCVGV